MICRKVACLGSKILPTIVTDRCSCLRKSALQMTRITSNNRSVFGQIHYTNTKPPEHPLPTVGSSSGFNVTFLHDWSSFDLPKLMPIETVNRTHFLWCCIMVVSYQCSSKSYSLPLSQSGICRRQRSQKWTKRGPYSRRPLPQSLPNPLPLSTPATQAIVFSGDVHANPRAVIPSFGSKSRKRENRFKGCSNMTSLAAKHFNFEKALDKMYAHRSLWRIDRHWKPRILKVSGIHSYYSTAWSIYCVRTAKYSSQVLEFKKK